MDNGNGASDEDSGGPSSGSVDNSQDTAESGSTLDLGGFSGSVSAVDLSQSGVTQSGPGSLDLSGDGNAATIDSDTTGTNATTMSFSTTGKDLGVLAGTAATTVGVLSPGVTLGRLGVVGGSATVGGIAGPLGTAVSHVGSDVSTAVGMGFSGPGALSARDIAIQVTESTPAPVVAAGPVAVDNYHAVLNLGFVPS